MSLHATSLRRSARRLAGLSLAVVGLLLGCAAGAPSAGPGGAASGSGAASPGGGSSAAAGGSAAALANTYWRLVEVEGEPVTTPPDQRSEPHLRFSGDGRSVRGSTGCNSVSGPFEHTDRRTAFGPLVSTRMVCTEARLARQEQLMLGALRTADRIERAGERLTLYSGERVVGRLVAAEPR